MGNIKSKSIILGVAAALGGVLFFSHSAYAASYINVSSAGSVTFGSIRPTSSGTSATTSDKLTVNTNCNAGYSVYVSGQNGKDTNLTNKSAESDNIISTSSTAVGETATTLNVNTWGLNSENNGTYIGLPEYSETLPPALVTIPSASETSTVDIYYGLKVNTALTPGTYTGDVLYTVLSNSACSVYTVRFNANGGTGTMADQTINVGQAANLSINTFTRSGYMFLGWATSPSATAPTYKDGQSVTDIADFNTTLNLYAVWGKSTGNMQDFTCTNLASGATTYLTDIRDSQAYSIYRIPTNQTYKDSTTIANIAGKCLMTKDLSLGYVTGGSITRGSNLVLSTDTSTGETTSNAPIYARAGTDDWSSANDDINLQYINGPLLGYEAYSNHSYYSFGAAQKVCPKGWRLPTMEEYATNSVGASATVGLAAIVGNDIDGAEAIQAIPWNYIPGGRFYSSGWDLQGVYGLYWSSMQSGLNQGYDGRFNMSNVYYGNNVKNGGRSVRCIAQSRYTINYSVNGASGSASKSTEGTLYENNSITTATVNTMNKTGYHFLGWSTNSSATAATYTAGASVSVSTLASAASAADGGTITLYAVWAPNTYTIKFNGQGGTVGTSSTTGTYGKSITSSTASYSGYNLVGWSHTAYTAGQGSATYATTSTVSLAVSTLASAAGVANTNNATITLYAVWKKSEPTVVGDCSETIHPTASQACKMKDNNYWVYGNSGNSVTWNNLCTSSDNCKSLTYCPSGYAIPTEAMYDTLKTQYGASLYYNLGLYNPTYYWSSTQYDDSTAYYIYVYGTGAIVASGAGGKTNHYKVLCYKQPA